MEHDKNLKNRRTFLKSMAAISTLTCLGGLHNAASAHAVRPPQPDAMMTKAIPSSGEAIPVIGMGSWITFNVGENVNLRNERTEILREFFRRGGNMVDCSPMYGTSAEVIGYALNKIENKAGLFSASKVWTPSTQDGVTQMTDQRKKWDIDSFDLMQIHNLRNWEGHLETLQRMKSDGQIRYIGMTTSHGRRHDDMEKIMEKQEIDFVQMTYNIVDREGEDRLLPLAKERGIAVIANRPYKQKALFRQFQNNPIPDWAREEADAKNWAEFLLKFIVSHDAVTCAIPATSNIQHMKENMGAGYGRMPDAKTRQRMIDYIQTL